MKYVGHEEIFFCKIVISVCSFMTGFINMPENYSAGVQGFLLSAVITAVSV